MRKLKTTDVFEALRLVQKSGLKDQLVPIIEKYAKEPTAVERAGITGILTVVEVFAEKKCENLIYEFLARPFECSGADVGDWDLEQLATNLEALAAENDLPRFFGSLSGLLKKKS